MEKNYYLPKWRRSTAGFLLIIFGYLNLHIGINAEEVMPFIIGFSLFISGILTIKKDKKVLKAKLDKRGFYYAPMKFPFNMFRSWIQNQNQNQNKFNFTPYDDIKYVVLEKYIMGLKQIHMTTKNSGSPNLMGLSELKSSDKEELVEAIKRKISQQKNKEF